MTKHHPINQANNITINQLCVGLYVHLDVGWMDHPFAFSNFKIEDEAQIEKIKAIGLKSLRYDPTRSDRKPLPRTTKPATKQTAKPSVTVEKPTPNFKEQRLIQLHKAIDENEKKFIETSNLARLSTRSFLTNSTQSIAQANTIVNDLMEVALTEGDVAIHAINGNRASDENYLHSMNVLVLCLMMSKTLDLSKEDAHTLGLAAHYHDIGKLKVSDKILFKKEPLTKSEQFFFQEHVELGAQLVLEAGLSQDVSRIIHQHHELIDGTGYPKQLVEDEIDPLARLLGLVNAYDNLCNPFDFSEAKTPYEALGYLFTHQRSKYDQSLLKRMIKTLGIYPPGSVVQLSSGVYANVISGNTSHPLRPFVMLHETNKQDHAPVIIDLREEPNLHISICLRPNQLPPEVAEYLNLQKRINYFLDTALVNAHLKPQQIAKEVQSQAS